MLNATCIIRLKLSITPSTRMHTRNSFTVTEYSLAYGSETVIAVSVLESVFNYYMYLILSIVCTLYSPSKMYELIYPQTVVQLHLQCTNLSNALDINSFYIYGDFSICILVEDLLTRCKS